jgi:hypothetical protein
MNMQWIYEFDDIAAQHDLRLIDLLQGEIDLDVLSDEDAEDDGTNHFFD